MSKLNLNKFNIIKYLKGKVALKKVADADFPQYVLSEYSRSRLSQNIYGEFYFRNPSYDTFREEGFGLYDCDEQLKGRHF